MDHKSNHWSSVYFYGKSQRGKTLFKGGGGGPQAYTWNPKTCDIFQVGKTSIMPTNGVKSSDHLKSTCIVNALNQKSLCFIIFLAGRVAVYKRRKSWRKLDRIPSSIHFVVRQYQCRIPGCERHRKYPLQRECIVQINQLKKNTKDYGLQTILLN